MEPPYVQDDVGLGVAGEEAWERSLPEVSLVVVCPESDLLDDVDAVSVGEVECEFAERWVVLHWVRGVVAVESADGAETESDAVRREEAERWRREGDEWACLGIPCVRCSVEDPERRVDQVVDDWD